MKIVRVVLYRIACGMAAQHKLWAEHYTARAEASADESMWRHVERAKFHVERADRWQERADRLSR